MTPNFMNQTAKGAAKLSYRRTLPRAVQKEYDRFEIPVYNEQGNECMRKAGRVVGNTLSALRHFIKPGISTNDISDFCKSHIESQGAIASSLGYFGFPGAACTSVNDSVCHGIPTRQVLKNGDVVKVDITCNVDGWFGDSCYTYAVGEASEEVLEFIDVGRKCLRAGIEAVKPGAMLAEVGEAIQNCADENNVWVVQGFCGHGIGQVMHQQPQVLHFPCRSTKERLIEGMFFTIEPIIGMGRHPGQEFYTLPDNWTIMSMNKSWCAQFEHCIGVTANGYEIFTLPDELFDDILHIRTEPTFSN